MKVVNIRENANSLQSGSASFAGFDPVVAPT